MKGVRLSKRPTITYSMKWPLTRSPFANSEAKHLFCERALMTCHLQLATCDFLLPTERPLPHHSGYHQLVVDFRHKSQLLHFPQIQG